MQAHAALQLAPSGIIAGFYAMRSHVWSQACILEKKKKKKTSCCVVMSCQARTWGGQTDPFLVPKLTNASDSNKYTFKCDNLIFSDCGVDIILKH